MAELDSILKRTAKYYGIAVAAITRRRRTEPIATVRGLVMVLAHESGHADAVISGALGLDSSSVVVLRVKSMRARIDSDPVLKRDLQRIRRGFSADGPSFLSELATARAKGFRENRRRNRGLGERFGRGQVRRAKVPAEPLQEDVERTSDSPGFGSLEILEMRMAVAAAHEPLPIERFAKPRMAA